MKKLLLILTSIIFTFCLIGCNLQDPKYINFSTKPNNHYYTDELHNIILNNKDFSISVFDTNLYKEIIVEKYENPVIENFINSLTYDNYLNEEIPEDQKELYRIKVIFNDNKFLIKVYDNSLISISPWDGNYHQDVISMDNVPLRYNLLDFCHHVQNKPSAS